MNASVDNDEKPNTVPENNARALNLPAPSRNIVVRKWDDARQYLIHHLPRWMLNNSSNFVGSIQLIAEMFMFKSSNNNLISDKYRSKPLYWVFDVPRNIVSASLSKSKVQGEFRDFLKPSSYPKFFKDLADRDTAALIDSEFNTVKLTNRWSARSGLVGMTSMTIATLLPEHSEGPEETKKMVDMAHDHPLQYVGHRFYQALNPVEVWKNKRPLVGLGMTITGLLSVISGFRQVEGKLPEVVKRTEEVVELAQRYRKNYGQMAGGAITIAAGLQLFFAVNNEQGWRRFGTTQLARFATLPWSIGERFSKNPLTGQREQGAAWYFGAQSLMAVKNSIASLIGGVEVKKDGVLVDDAVERKEIIAEEKEERRERKQHVRISHQDTSISKVHNDQRMLEHHPKDTVLPSKLIDKAANDDEASHKPANSISRMTRLGKVANDDERTHAKAGVA